MPRNRSEKGPQVLLEKMVQPGTWEVRRPAQLLVLPDGTHKLQVQCLEKADGWHWTVAPTYSDLLEVYEAMVDGFLFRIINAKFAWTFHDAS